MIANKTARTLNTSPFLLLPELGSFAHLYNTQWFWAHCPNFMADDPFI